MKNPPITTTQGRPHLVCLEWLAATRHDPKRIDMHSRCNCPRPTPPSCQITQARSVATGWIQFKEVTRSGVDALSGAAVPLSCHSNDARRCTAACLLVWQPPKCYWQLQYWLDQKHPYTQSLPTKCPAAAMPICSASCISPTHDMKNHIIPRNITSKEDFCTHDTVATA